MPTLKKKKKKKHKRRLPKRIQKELNDITGELETLVNSNSFLIKTSTNIDYSFH